MGQGLCVDAGSNTFGSGGTWITKDNSETWSSKYVRLARQCVVVTGAGNVKLGIFYNVSGTTWYFYKAVKLNNPSIAVVAGNNIVQSDRNWFQIGANTYRPGVYNVDTIIRGETTGGSGYWLFSGEVTEDSSQSFTEFSNASILRVGFLIIDCSITGTNTESLNVGDTRAYYGNVNYQTWDVPLSQAFLNINAPWAIEGAGFSGYVTVGTYAYTTTTTIGSTLYTYKVYINSANSSTVGYTEYLYVQETLNDIYINASTGDDLNTGASCSVPVKTFAKAYSLLNAGGTIHCCATGYDFSAETVTRDKSYSMTVVGDGYWYDAQAG